MHKVRFYTEYTDVDKVFLTTHKRGWIVFDTQSHFGNGDRMPLAFCLLEQAARLITTTLNEDNIRQERSSTDAP
jgi:hypothetical protein